jgi:hypothetical protein
MGDWPADTQIHSCPRRQDRPSAARREVKQWYLARSVTTQKWALRLKRPEFVLSRRGRPETAIPLDSPSFSPRETA